MAVFTPVSSHALQEWLTAYPVGSLQTLEGIPSGIENTNYFVTTDQGQFVLTLFEKLHAEELPYYLNLMAHLSNKGVPCPRPIANQQGVFLGTLCGKPASLATRLAGKSQMTPGPQHCAAFGGVVAQLHEAGADYPINIPNPRGPSWWVATAPLVRPFVGPAQQRLLDDEIAFQTHHRFEELPRDPVHADLFRDNVLMEGERVGGVIDFYFAGTDAWLFDLAVVVNDWCMTSDAILDAHRVTALLSAYNAVRPLLPAEQAAWPLMLRAAALRFWLSRLFDQFLPRDGELIHPHDPVWFERILHHHVHQPSPWPL